MATKLFLSIVLVLGFYLIAYKPFTEPINTHNYEVAPPTELVSYKLTNKNQLNIVTYNVHGLPHSENPTCDNLIAIGKEIGKLRTSGQAPDIIALQEGFHKKTEDLIRLSGYPYVARGPGISYEKTKISSGLWILSEYPVRTVESETYSTCASLDCWANKGIQKVIVNVGGVDKKIEVYNTHMNAYSEYDPWTDTDDITKAKDLQISQFKRLTHKG